MGITIKHTERLTADEAKFWADALRDRELGPLTVVWTEAIRAAGPSTLEIYYLQAFADGEPRALGVLHILRRLDLAGYIGGAVASAFGLLARAGWLPLAADLAFLEIPSSNVSGFRLVPGAEGMAEQLAGAMLAHVRRSFRYAILCVKSARDRSEERAFARMGLLSTGFLATMWLNLEGLDSYEDYLRRLPGKTRHQCRQYQRDFAKAGGTIETVERFDESVFAMMNRLYGMTMRYHAEHSNLQVPIPLGPRFFAALAAAMPPGSLRAHVAKLGGEPVGFMLALDAADTIYFFHCGLDRERTIPSRAYFNLYYALIADAIRRRKRVLRLGAEAYPVKKKLGGAAAPTVYDFEVRHPAFRAITRLVARNLSSQDGSKL
jgi:predicted N-acyltransferase